MNSAQVGMSWLVWAKFGKVYVNPRVGLREREGGLTQPKYEERVDSLNLFCKMHVNAVRSV